MHAFSRKNFYQHPFGLITNPWDMVALILVLGIFISLGWAAREMTAPFHLGESIIISLKPSALPYYALRTVLRMFIALWVSLLFTFIFGTWAAKSKHAERLIIPAIDILQSVPILGFLSITASAFLALFPTRFLGPECAAIFVIFTSQAWNMALGFYQSIRTLPNDFHEVSAVFHLSAWQCFWRVEVPFALPALLWNTMMSMSASWFFVVAAEAISVTTPQITLPGIGSYIGLAITQANSHAVVYAIVAMLIVIVLYDQLLFRPMLSWAERFKMESSQEDNEIETPWLVKLLRRTRLLSYMGSLLAQVLFAFVNIRFRPKRKASSRKRRLPPSFLTGLIVLWYVVVGTALLVSLKILMTFIFSTLSLHEAYRVIVLGIYTGTRVFTLIMLCSLIWVPVGVWVGLHPKATRIIQPIAQFLAAFPANCLFPVVVMFIVHYHLNVEIWTTPLMILGTQWYILFNVIAGTSALPKDLYYAAKNFNVRGWVWWRRLMLPAIFPYYVTGALTAAGGAWNASILAEVVQWGDTTLRATGLGEYIARYTALNDYPRVALGIGIMCLLVVVINRLVWRPLYNLAERRFQLG